MENSFWIPTTISLASLYWNYYQSRKILRLETDAQRKTLIHKFQFEKEFNVYTELWARLVDVKDRVRALRPVGEIVDATKTEEERKTEKLKEVWKKMFDLQETYEKNRPFYSKDIYKEVDDLLKTSKFETIDFDLLDRKDRNYWDTTESNAKKVVDSMDKILTMIRKRIEIIETKK